MPQITHTDTSSAKADISAAPQITHTDTSSADTIKTAVTQITDTDTSSAKADISAAPQITHTDTSSADTIKTAVTQITHTDTSSANANKTAATQITDTDTSAANTNITTATTDQLHTLSGPLLMHSPSWRALRRSRKRLRTVADGCAHRHNFPRTQPHPQTPKWNGNPRYAFGKKRVFSSWIRHCDRCRALVSTMSKPHRRSRAEVLLAVCWAACDYIQLHIQRVGPFVAKVMHWLISVSSWFVAMECFFCDVKGLRIKRSWGNSPV